MAELLLGSPLFPGESGVDQLVEIIKVRQPEGWLTGLCMWPSTHIGRGTLPCLPPPYDGLAAVPGRSPQCRAPTAALVCLGRASAHCESALATLCRRCWAHRRGRRSTP